LAHRHYARLERLAQGLEDMAAEFGQVIQEKHAMLCQRHFPRVGTYRPPISPASGMV